MNNKVVLKVKGLTKIFKEGKDSLEVLKGIDLEVEEGVSVAIVGTSGSGKSTLLQCLGALDTFDAGSVEIDGENIADLSEKQRTQMRNRKLGFVYQFHHLLPEFTSLENTAMPLKIRRVPAAEAQKRAEHLLWITFRVSSRAESVSVSRSRAPCAALRFVCSPMNLPETLTGRPRFQCLIIWCV